MTQNLTNLEYRVIEVTEDPIRCSECGGELEVSTTGHQWVDQSGAQDDFTDHLECHHCMVEFVVVSEDPIPF